jgi:hypothetical protein
MSMPTKEVTDYQLTTATLSPDERRRAVLAVATAAFDAGECAHLLDMLGLDPAEAYPAVPAPRA